MNDGAGIAWLVDQRSELLILEKLAPSLGSVLRVRG